MLDVIINNPFRVLGVYSSAKQAEILKNANKMKAYLNVGKEISFPTDMNYLFSKINRTIESVVNAQTELNLPKDRIRHALFWFCSASPVDDVALKYLVAENPEKAIEICEKKSSFASILNLAVLSIALKQYSSAASLYALLVHTPEYSSKLLATVCDVTFQITESELMHIVIDELLKVEKPLQLVNSLNDEQDKGYVKEKALSEPIDKIISEINIAKSVSGSDADASLHAGKALIRNTKTALSTIKSLVGSSHPQYQSIADKLANQILQCGINYFNNSDDDDDVENALEIQQYALNISVGKMVKDRCKQNVDILLKKKSQSAYEKDIAAIAIELKSFQSAIPAIVRARTLVNNCKPHLDVIKSILGSTDEFYLKISSAVANNALGMLISVVNDAQSTSSVAYNIASGSLASVIDDAIRTMSLIGTLDMTSQERSHFNQNNLTLKNLKSSLNSISQSSSSSTNSSTISSSSGDTNWGCIIWIILGVIGLIIAAVSN